MILSKKSKATLAVATLQALLIIAGCGGGGISGGGGGGGGGSTPLVITTATLPKSVTGSAYNVKLQASGGKGQYSWSLGPPPGSNTVSSLPPGLSLLTDGTIRGTAAADCYSVWFPQFVVQDAASQTARIGLELDCVPPLALPSNALPDGNIALQYSFIPPVQGGLPPYQFSLADGSLPPGMTLDKNRAFQGTPTSAGKYNLTLQVSDSGAPTLTASRPYTLIIGNNLVLPQSTLPDAVQNLAYREQILPAGGTPPYHFAKFPDASLPPGLTLDSNTGIVSGTPTSAQLTDFVYMTITDSAPTPASIFAAVTLTVQPPLAFQTTSLTDCIRNQNCNENISIVGGRAPYHVTLGSGSLPDGITISSTPYTLNFSLTGSPTKDGTFPFNLKVADSYEAPNTATQSFQIRVSDPLAISGPGTVELLYGQSYSATFPTTGGIPPYTWSIETVPPGFTFDPATGMLNGTGATKGSFTAPNVTVRDSSNPVQRATYFQFVLDVYGKLTILSSSLPPITTGAQTWISLDSSGGGGGFTWTISSGALPPGMTFTSVGNQATITGTATTPGTYNFTIHVVDENTGNLQQTLSNPMTLVVKDPSQFGRNDSIATATPVSNITLLASVSPFTDPQSTSPDADYYSASAMPGSIVQVYVSANNDFLQPPEPNSMLPVIEVVDANSTRYNTCGYYALLPGQVNNLPCVNRLPGHQYLSNNYFAFQVPGSGSTPVKFYVRISDERGDARPDFIYTFGIHGAN
ncbi:MAG TPA: putative Ig domain-containing protein [Candidatus Eisenbacteria bacterium]|nr:putative Ig domain-containing protein [Candidatus Eisenbacteria bacterium]